jgi:hypothetical protein
VGRRAGGIEGTDDAHSAAGTKFTKPTARKPFRAARRARGRGHGYTDVMRGARCAVRWPGLVAGGRGWGRGGGRVTCVKG